MNPTTKIKIRDAAKNLSTVLVEVDLRCRQKVTLDSVGQRKRKQEIVTKPRRRLIRTEGPGRKLRIRQSQDKTMKRKSKSSGLFQVLTKFIKGNVLHAVEKRTFLVVRSDFTSVLF